LAVPGAVVVLAVKRQVPQENWQTLEVRLRHLSSDLLLTLKPQGVRKGRKIAFSTPEKLAPGEFEVQLACGDLAFPGVLVLEIANSTREEFSA
jgi:hypothetical protein